VSKSHDHTVDISVDELYNLSAGDSAIHRPELSQPICTAIQVAIVDLLFTWKVQASTVVGHSSGEIAAAYASGAISRESAWMVAYFRGLAVAIARDFMSSVGSMVAVQAEPELITPLLKRQNATHPQDTVVIACYNSASNLTISGSRDAVNRLMPLLSDANIAYRLLNVEVAYHSHHMKPVATIYSKLLRLLEPGEQREDQPQFISTVTGNLVEDTNILRSSEYWMQNLTAPVQFSTAMNKAFTSGAKQSSTTMADFFVEIGPHSTLRSPLKENGRDIVTNYTSMLVRNRAADITALECAGKLYSAGSSIDLAEVNGSRSSSANLVTTLPLYPFNDKTKYWMEGRASAQYRFRSHLENEFLGTRVDDWNECEARWTNRVILGQAHWLKDHEINGLIIYPAAGFMVMALEAVRQVYDGQSSVIGYKMKDIKFPKAVTLSQDPRGTELQLTLRTTNNQLGSSISTRIWHEFFIYVYENDGWVECCSGAVVVEFKDEDQHISETDERIEFLGTSVRSINDASKLCSTRVDSPDIYEAFARAGLCYGPFFRALQDVRSVDLHQWKSLHDGFTDPHLIHPTALDGILQLTFPAFSIYAKNASATTVPTGFRSAWFPAFIDNSLPSSEALVHAKVTKRSFRNKTFSITAAFAEGEVPVFCGEMETATIGTSSSSSDIESKLLYKIEYQPDFDLLPKRKLYLDSDRKIDLKLIHDKESLCLTSMRSALEQLPDNTSLPPHLQEYVKWMRMKLEKHATEDLESVESMCQRLEHTDVEARLLVRVARNLSSILIGETDPLNLLSVDDILSDFYANFHSNQQLLSRAAKEIHILAHKYPAMRILEIGAGTGSATAHILGALGNRFAEYVYTGVTSSSFVKAKDNFALPNLTFKTLDVSQDPLEQDFKQGEFDLIVAANVSVF
jgi:acyl transferase domain-containing protein